MRVEDAAQAARAELARTLERQIVQKTWGRVRQFQVHVSDRRVLVLGYTSTYYVKQIAIQAILEVVGAAEATPVEVDIQVDRNDAWCVTGRHP